MSWENPWVLLALLLPAAAAWYVWRTARGAKLLWPALLRVSLSASNTLKLVPPATAKPSYWMLAALALGIIALARPQWGEHAEQSFSQSSEVMIALDLSRSMGVVDMPNAGSRLNAAKASINALLDQLKGENVGLILFAGTSFVQVPMSPDYQIVRQFLPSLEPAYMPVGGSDYDRLISSALEGFGDARERDRYLIVLSDGESTTQGWDKSVQRLIERNIHVIGVGFGSDQGGTVPDQTIVSRLNPATLQTLAGRTDGLYIAASQEADSATLGRLVKETIETGRVARVHSGSATAGAERFQWLLAPAILLALISLAGDFPYFPRSRRIRPEIVAATLCALSLTATPKVQSHEQQINANTGSQATSAGDAAAQVRALATHMGTLGYDTGDLRLFIEAAIHYGADQRQAGRLPLEGVMRDAVDAIRVGRQLAPGFTGWAQYETQIHDLLLPLPERLDPNDDIQPQQDEEDEEDEQNYRAVPLRKAKDKDGKDLYGKNRSARAEFALGDLSGEETFMPQEPHGHRRRQPRSAQAIKLAQSTNALDEAALAEARKNMATVVKADSPARVHQLLNGEAGLRAAAQDY